MSKCVYVGCWIILIRNCRLHLDLRGLAMGESERRDGRVPLLQAVPAPLEGGPTLGRPTVGHLGHSPSLLKEP